MFIFVFFILMLQALQLAHISISNKDGPWAETFSRCTEAKPVNLMPVSLR